MKKITAFSLIAILCLVVFSLGAGPGSAAADEGKVPAKKGKVPAKEDAAGKAFVTSLTVYPVRMAGRPFQKVAEAIGLILEKNGFRNLAIGETPFAPKDEATFEETAAAFGIFVAKQGIKTDYALFGEFVGSPKEGVKAVRGVIADRKGKVVWTDEQKPGDKEFDRSKPKCPMSSCVFLAERLEPALIPSKAGEAGGEGAMERLWAARSAHPEKAEFAAMENRLEAMKKSAGKATLLVYPVRTGKKVDRAGAELLTKTIADRKLIRTETAETGPWFDIKRNSNEQRVLWDMARAFQAHVRKNPPAADYVLYADLMFHPEGEREAGAVHFVVCDRKGDWVIVDFQNNHHDDFRKIKPRTCADCSRLAALRLAGYLD